MIGVSMDMSKACCPMYNVCTSNKRLSSLPLPKVSTKHVLKHRDMSPRASLRSQVPAVGGAVLLGVGIAGMASNKARAHAISTTGAIEGVLKSNACWYIILGVAAVFVARGFLGNISRACAVLFENRFSVGDIIQVGSMKGKVVDMGIKTTSLDTADNHRVVVPTFWFHGQDVLNLTRAPWHSIALTIYVEVDDTEKVSKIAEEVVKMMRSNPDVYLEDEQPYCYISGVEPTCVELSLGCKLKQASERELTVARRKVLLKAVQTIQDYGVELSDPKQKRLQSSDK